MRNEKIMDITEQINELVEKYGNEKMECRIDLNTNQIIKNNGDLSKPIFLALDYLKGIECILRPIAVCEYPDSESRKIFLYLQSDHFGCIASNGIVFGSIFEETEACAIAEFKRLYAHPQQFNFSITIL